MWVCGVDESGRGPLAGPVTAAAVVLPKRSAVSDRRDTGLPTDALFSSLADSKCLTPERRTFAAVLIKEQALAWAIGWSWPEEIDQLNIHRATLLAMNRALSGIYPAPDFVIVDGLFVPDCGLRGRAVVRGDEKIKSIMAASILAKTERDLWMTAYSEIDPRYGFEIHKGYATPEHRMQIKRHGMSAIHRRSFSFFFPE
jgi:ribonuclease HII